MRANSKSDLQLLAVINIGVRGGFRAHDGDKLIINRWEAVYDVAYIHTHNDTHPWTKVPRT